MRKYDFTGETIEYNGIILKQIIRLSDNLVGGYIESEDNLSHQGDCFVYDNAKVFNNARIYDDATVSGRVVVCDNASIFKQASVYNNSKVFENAKVFGNAMVSDNVKVYGNARIYDNAQVEDDVEVFDNAIVCQDSEVLYKDKVTGRLIYLTNVCQFDITASKKDDYIRVGCKKHSVLEWVSYIESGEDFYLEECENEIEYYRCISMIQHIIYLFETMD